jgi:putative ATP-binding cassette transporter
LIGHWLGNVDFLQLRFASGEDQNPEYRIAEDARVATEAPVALAVGLLSAVLGAIFVIGVLWTVGGDLTTEMASITLTVPKYLVISAVLYSALLTIAMAVVGQRLVKAYAGKNAAEAQLRSIGSHLREGKKFSTALHRETEQGRELEGAVDDVIARARTLCHQLMGTTLISQGNALIAPIVGWVLCAPKYLTGTMSLGEVAQVTSAFIIVLGALNWMVENYSGMADCLSSINRVGSLLLALDDLEQR